VIAQMFFGPPQCPTAAPGKWCNLTVEGNQFGLLLFCVGRRATTSGVISELRGLLGSLTPEAHGIGVTLCLPSNGAYLHAILMERGNFNPC
jgi:hypothetical protein